MKKYRFGKPIETESVIEEIEPIIGAPEIGTSEIRDGKFIFTYPLAKNDAVYGLGEAARGMNKRGWEYISDATDNPQQHEARRTTYGAHNFLVVDGENPFGIYVDQPSKVRFDVGYTNPSELKIEADANLDFYIIEGKDPLDITRQFRKAIGQSYIAPKFALGYAQSRWGYKTPDDFRNVLKNLRGNDIPVDLINMDIDYMDSYKDFTFNDDFKNFKDFVDEFKAQNVHLVPIIDAAIKKEDGFDVYDEGKEKGYFCKLEDGKEDFVGAVWPGYSVFPDFLNDEARSWFGHKYKVLTDAGIDAFWNDMNEPAIFYSQYGIDEVKEFMKEYIKDSDQFSPFELSNQVEGLKNSPKDYARFYHNKNGQRIRHDKVHNLYGYYMTRSASEAFDDLRPDLRTLMYSRSSYIGMHRYGGIWTGDNQSFWRHILMLLQQLPGLNMAGFLYTGADLGGFGQDSTPDLVMRFNQLGLFTPLMRNHSALGTREQEPYQFENVEDFAHVIGVRYRLLPYLYSEYMKAALNNDMMFKPLAFEFRDDPFASQVEDQILLGDEIMIAPVYVQNAKGRYVYLPEEMMKTVFKKDGTIETEVMPAGHHYIDYPLDEVVFFIRKGKALPVVDKALSVPELDESTMQMIGYDGGKYDLYEDDGITTNYADTLKTLTK